MREWVTKKNSRLFEHDNWYNQHMSTVNNVWINIYTRCLVACVTDESWPPLYWCCCCSVHFHLFGKCGSTFCLLFSHTGALLQFNWISPVWNFRSCWWFSLSTHVQYFFRGLENCVHPMMKMNCFKNWKICSMLNWIWMNSTFQQNSYSNMIDSIFCAKKWENFFCPFGNSLLSVIPFAQMTHGSLVINAKLIENNTKNLFV